MKRLIATIAALGLCAIATACSKDQSQRVMNKEDLMIASGFTFVPANTPARQAAFAQLPPHKFTRQIRGDKVVYVYADPTICVCLYVGNPKNYEAYRARIFDKQMANAQVTVANDMYYMNNDWDWGPWGTEYPLGWPYNF
jgi:hypothetical protein